MMRPTVAIIGVGSMGDALLQGLLGAGWEPSEISLTVRRDDQAARLTARTGCWAGLDPIEAIKARDVIVLAVKPRDVGVVLEALQGVVEPGQVVLSVAAGVPISVYEDALPEVAVVRAMPNTPALVGQGVTGAAAGSAAGGEELAKVRAVLEAVGSVRIVDESILDAVTAVSGTGPAYVFLLAEALTEAAIREGLSHHLAEEFVNQTIKGAAALLIETGQSPSRLRSQVTSPGGTTAAAIHVLEERGFRALVEDAVRAAASRSRELGENARR